MRAARFPGCKKSLDFCRSSNKVQIDINTSLHIFRGGGRSKDGCIPRWMQPFFIFCLGFRKGIGSHDCLDLLVGVCFLFCIGSASDCACVAGWSGGRADGLAAHASRKHCACGGDQYLRLVFNWMYATGTSVAVFGKCIGRRRTFVGGGACRRHFLPWGVDKALFSDCRGDRNRAGKQRGARMERVCGGFVGGNAYQCPQFYRWLGRAFCRVCGDRECASRHCVFVWRQNFKCLSSLSSRRRLSGVSLLQPFSRTDFCGGLRLGDGRLFVGSAVAPIVSRPRIAIFGTCALLLIRLSAHRSYNRCGTTPYAREKSVCRRPCAFASPHHSGGAFAAAM